MKAVLGQGAMPKWDAGPGAAPAGVNSLPSGYPCNGQHSPALPASSLEELLRRAVAAAASYRTLSAAVVVVEGPLLITSAGVLSYLPPVLDFSFLLYMP